MAERPPGSLEEDMRLVLGTFDSMSEGVQILSPEWRYLYVNVAAARHGRKSPEELAGRSMLECYAGMDKTHVFEVMSRCMRERRSERLENEFTYEDGSHAWFELHVQPCHAGIVVVSVDITARKRAEGALLESHQRALLELSTPVILIDARVLLVPLVGAIDSHRAAQIMETVLSRVVGDSARAVIVDVAGVPAMDTAVCHDLLQMAAAVRLLGAKTILTGITPSAAMTMVTLGLDLSAVDTTNQLAEGLQRAMAVAGDPLR